MGDRKALESELEYTKDLPGYDRSDPQFFSDPMIDKLLEITYLLGGEIWTNRDRQMVMEHLLATEGQVTPDLIETFKPDEEFEARSEEMRVQFIQRIYGCLYSANEKPMRKNFFGWQAEKQKGNAH